MTMQYLGCSVPGLLGEDCSSNPHQSEPLESELFVTLFFVVNEEFPVKEFAFNKLLDPNGLETNTDETVTIICLIQLHVNFSFPHRTLCSLSCGRREEISLADSRQKGHPNLRRKMMTQV